MEISPLDLEGNSKYGFDSLNHIQSNSLKIPKSDTLNHSPNLFKLSTLIKIDVQCTTSSLGLNVPHHIHIVHIALKEDYTSLFKC